MIGSENKLRVVVLSLTDFIDISLIFQDLDLRSICARATLLLVCSYTSI